MKKISAIVIIASFVAVVVLVTTVDLFRGNNRPAPPPPADTAEGLNREQKIALLILRLADDDAKKRNAAFDGLRQIGDAALPQLQAALNAVHPDVAADIRTLIKLMGGNAIEPLAQPPQPKEPGWVQLPELPKPVAPPAVAALPAELGQAGEPPAAPQIRKGMSAAERATFERNMQHDKNLRDLILVLRGRTPEKQAETLVWMQKVWGENSWDFESIFRYLGLDLLQPVMPTGQFSLDLLGSFGARLSAAEDGLRVTELREGTAAAAAGLRVGDLVTHFNGRQMTDLDKAREWFAQPAKGQPMRLDVKRRNEELTLTVPNP